MKILKRLSALSVILGISLLIAAPLWGQVQRSRMMSLHTQMEEHLENMTDIPVEDLIESEIGEQMILQTAKLSGFVRSVMHLLYAGLLFTLFGFSGITFCLNHEIKTLKTPNKRIEIDGENATHSPASHS